MINFIVNNMIYFTPTIFVLYLIYKYAKIRHTENLSERYNLILMLERKQVVRQEFYVKMPRRLQ